MSTTSTESPTRDIDLMGSIDRLIKVSEPSLDERGLAARAVAARAVDADDARMLLDALGLIEAPTADLG
jgi:hypothetical protein